MPSPADGGHVGDNAANTLAAEQTSVDALIDVVQGLSTARQLGEIQQIVRDAARNLTGADGATIALRDGERCHYVDESAIAPLWKGQRFRLDECISGWVMAHGEAAVIEDVYGDMRVPHDHYRPTFVASLAVVPVRAGDPIGAIGAYWGERHHPSEREVALLRSLADATAAALENVSVSTPSQTDELTGLNNRRAFFELALDAFHAELAAEGELAAVFVDLDGLRHVNDTYGHHAGSELIREAAAALVAISEERDILGRLGGDELALLRPGGVGSAQELHQAIAEAVAHASRADRPFGLAVSVGVSVSRAAEVRTLDGLLTRADLAMTAHKHSGAQRPHVRRADRPD
jgi:diguanylate cyclase (GGDEF)-like protein